MPTETGEALLVLVIFVLPGFITLVLKERTHEISTPASPFERLFSAIFYSLLVYTPLAVAGAICGLDRNEVGEIFRGDNGLWALTGLAVGAGLVLPALIAYIGAQWDGSALRVRALTALGLSPDHRVPSAWDYYFRHANHGLMAVTLRSGEVVGGYYGPDSFAAFSQTQRDLYLEEQWALDTETYKPLGPIKQSAGIWVPGGEIVQVELYSADESQLAIFEDTDLEAPEGVTGEQSEESNG